MGGGPRLPDAIVIGSPKAGTSSFAKALRQHPEIFMYKSVEARFFDERFDHGVSWYKDLFREAESSQIAMEKTPGYTEGSRSALFAERMAQTIPNAKLIFIARHPVERLISHCVQTVANQRDQKLLSLPEMISKRPFILETSLYHERISDYLQFYDRSHIHLMLLDDLISNWDNTLAEALGFLGVDSQLSIELEKTNTRATRLKPREELRGILRVLRRSPTWLALRDSLPSGLRKNIKRRVHQTVAVPDGWADPNQIPNDVLDLIRADAEKFLALAGKPQDTWII